MRTVSALSLLCLVLISTEGRAETTAAVELPEWLAGHWCGQEEGGAEEYWLAPAGGLMLAVNRTVQPGRRTAFEFLRIEMIDQVPTYIAMPQGKPGTAFARTAGGADWMRFENPSHDFPQLIEYRRNGNRLRAEIAGPGEGGKEMRMAFEFARCAE
jgi:hypothetical protein